VVGRGVRPFRFSKLDFQIITQSKTLYMSVIFDTPKLTQEKLKKTGKTVHNSTKTVHNSPSILAVVPTGLFPV
jgi:hypothetical protein